MLPRTIWCFWFQGWEHAPDLVKACLKTWQRRNPNWDFRLLSKESLSEYPAVQHVFLRADLPLEALSDILRIELLQRYGGVWVDATTYCLRPLDEWIHVAADSGFFAFNRPGPDRMLSSWFLAAFPNSYIVNRWHAATTAYWHHRTERHHYFWFHQLFEECYESDALFRATWDQTPKLSADGPHCFSPYEHLLKPPTRFHRLVAETTQTPLLKLTHKVEHEKAVDGSVYRWLCDLVTKRRELARKPRILVTWFGSLAGHGTIGDLLAAQSVTSYLHHRGHNVAHASATTSAGMIGTNYDIEQVNGNEFDVLIFVCGPIISGHPMIDKVIGKFGAQIKLGVGVSLFLPGKNGHVQPFDVLLAREGSSVQFEDVAILAPGRTLPHVESRLTRRFRIGLALRGHQTEYGTDACLDEDAHRIADSAIERVRSVHDVQIVTIENHLVRSQLTPTEIEGQYRNCDLVITTRFHGGMLALRNCVPFIAIDQIRGGAKVSKLLGRTRWPFVYRVDAADASTIDAAAEKLAQDPHLALLGQIARDTECRAHHTLSTLESILFAAESSLQ